MADLNPSLGRYVCAWIERFLVHAEGDYLGKPFILEPWQKQLVYRLYEYRRETLERIVRRVLIVLPKGCGKTELAAAVALAELCGPVVLSEDGRPTRRISPNIPVGAASFEQADRLFGAAKTMAVEGPLAEFVNAFDTEILLKGEVGRMFRIAAKAGTNDGGLPTAFMADEIHEWTGNKARVHLIVTNSLAKRDQGLEFNISTPDDADPASLIGKLAAYGEKVNNGEVDDPSFLFVHHGAPMDTDLNDPKALRKAIRGAHPASWINVDRVAARWEIDRIPEHEFRRYHLAQFVRGSQHWLPTGAWDECADEDRGLPVDGSTIWLGFDGSYDNDATALVGCTEDGYVFVVGVWERPSDVHGEWYVPREEVKARVAESMDRWNVRELACDPPGWHREIDEWADTYGDTVVQYQTNRRTTMSDACSRLYSAVVKGDMTHDGNTVLTRHIANAVVKETPDGAYITKDGRKSSRKIDAAVAAVIAYDRAQQPVAEPFVLVI